MKILLATLALMSFAAPVLAQTTVAPATAEATVAPADARSAELLRDWIESSIAGQPDYALLTTTLADAVRPQAAPMLTLLEGFGALQSIEHAGVEGAADVFIVRFASQVTRWTIVVNDQGLIGGLRMRPAA